MKREGRRIQASLVFMLLLEVIAGGPVRAAGDAAIAIESRRPTAREAVLGSCLTATGPYDLKLLKPVRLSSLQYTFGNRSYSLTIDGERVIISESTGRDWKVAAVLRVDRLVDPKNDLDLELQAELLNGAPAVYWRESYHHKSHRQGVFRVHGSELVRFCEGRGGIDTFD